jgi:GNAT superfamily N-acetyltransferase
VLAQSDATPVGFLAVTESRSLYAEGRFGVIQELYVQPAARGHGVGAALIAAALTLAQSRVWTRLEVTTPALPAFERTLAFYERHGFAISGGRKLRRATA